MHYLYLFIAIVSEVIGTTSLKSCNRFSQLGPTLIVLVAFGSAFYFLALTIERIPIAVTYAIWSGVGIVLIAISAAIVHRQRPDAGAVVGIALIVAGVVVLNLFSRMEVH